MVPRTALTLSLSKGYRSHSNSITAELEERMEGTVWWIKYRYQTDRNQSLIGATVDNITATMLWRQELEDKEDPDPQKFPSTLTGLSS